MASVSCGRSSKNRSKRLAVVAEGWRELPEDRAELFLQGQHPGGEEVGERLFDLAQLTHVGDEAAAFHCEDEVVGGLRVPALVAVKGIGGNRRSRLSRWWGTWRRRRLSSFFWARSSG